ncbi:Nicotinamidase-related amidase [Seinonella peptonophila]|uniref:Nicotinamidase-related amidase n=1 Tax=Seinonella peptonophila TaxID=112248 RepID=A0A1M4V5R5_9BACL|nr:isochorismatase family protein [Seinonella peptonophila]SHE64242.1 Nicotinamidase-related amidase [Seinonella peptonophila]
MGQTEAFFQHILEKVEQAPNESLDQLITQAGDITSIFLVFVDILKGFCEKGALSSLRVNEMVIPVKQLTEKLLSKGMPEENLIFLNDHHPTQAVEFAAFAPHCIAGTEEAEVVDLLKPFQSLPTAQTYLKNSTNGLFGVNQQGKRFFEWLEERFQIGKSLFMIVGDCTDLCIYQNAMGIRLMANQYNADVDIVVPVSHVRTYDVPVKQAAKLGIPAHDGDVLDTVFLYHMQLNGVRIIQSIAD